MRNKSKKQASLFCLKSICLSLLFVTHISCKAKKKPSKDIIVAGKDGLNIYYNQVYED